MTDWPWWALALAGVAATYLGLLAALVVAGRTGQARALARFVPDCVVLFSRLVRDPRVPRRRRWVLVALVAYLATPIDLVPDFVPVVGALDDAIVAGVALRYVLRGCSPELLDEHWPGPAASLDVLLRLAGRFPRPAAG